MQKETSISWANLFTGNRVAENGMPLTYIPPEIVNGTVVVQVDKNEVEKEAEK